MMESQDTTAPFGETFDCSEAETERGGHSGSVSENLARVTCLLGTSSRLGSSGFTDVLP